MICGLDEIEKAVRKTEEFLDKIDIRKYLSAGKDLYEVIDEIEDDYEEVVRDDPFFQGYVFNCMSPDEFGEYITKRYGILIYEDVSITYRIGGHKYGTD